MMRALIFCRLAFLALIILMQFVCKAQLTTKVWVDNEEKSISSAVHTYPSSQIKIEISLPKGNIKDSLQHIDVNACNLKMNKEDQQQAWQQQ